MSTVEELTKQFKADNPDLSDDEALHLAEQSLKETDIMPFTDSIPEGYIAHKHLNFAIKGDKFNKETLAKFYQLPEFLALDVSKRASIKREFNKVLKAKMPAEPQTAAHIAGSSDKPIAISTEQHKKNLKHVFNWAMPLDLTAQTAKDMMLIKFVAMTEGEMKRGEIMTSKNVTFGAGAMSTAAMFGMAVCDIDHFDDALPAQYVEKYGKEINDPYPVAIILDADAQLNTIEPDNKQVMQVEGIGYCTNRAVYDMIVKGMFKGCSVVDYYRKENCSECGGSGGCNCTIMGSHFLRNTFVLDEVPNSNATWVAPVTEEDIGTILIGQNDIQRAQSMQGIHKNAIKMAQFSLLKHTMESKRHEILSEYTDETGKFIEGKAGITKFLVEEKGIPEITAKDIADYLFTHPNALTQYQYEYLSTEDLLAWYRHIVDKNHMQEMTAMRKHVAMLQALKHNYTALKTLKNFTQFEKTAVDYKPAAAGTDEACMNCIYYMPDTFTDLDGDQGWCVLVEGNIDGGAVCNRFESATVQETSEGVIGNTAAHATKATKPKYSPMTLPETETHDQIEYAVFTTKLDKLVRAECKQFAGQVFKVDPSTHEVIGGPEIGKDTHEGCRCTYVIVKDIHEAFAAGAMHLSKLEETLKPNPTVHVDKEPLTKKDVVKTVHSEKIAQIKSEHKLIIGAHAGRNQGNYHKALHSA